MQKGIRRFFMALAVFLYRSSSGRIGGRIGSNPVLLLTTTGRKSGKSHTVPVMYIMDGSAYIIVASDAGADKHPGWFFNLQSNPQATIEAQEKTLSVMGEVADPEKTAELWPRLLEVAPFFADYQKRTSRKMPIMLLRPVDEAH